MLKLSIDHDDEPDAFLHQLDVLGLLRSREGSLRNGPQFLQDLFIQGWGDHANAIQRELLKFSERWLAGKVKDKPRNKIAANGAHAFSDSFAQRCPCDPLPQKRPNHPPRYHHSAVTTESHRISIS